MHIAQMRQKNMMCTFIQFFLLIKSITFLADMEENDSKFYWKGRNPDDPQIAVKEDNMYHPDRFVFYLHK